MLDAAGRGGDQNEDAAAAAALLGAAQFGGALGAAAAPGSAAGAAPAAAAAAPPAAAAGRPPRVRAWVASRQAPRKHVAACCACCSGFEPGAVRLASRANPDRHFRHPACIAGGVPLGSVEGLAALPEEARVEIFACTAPLPGAVPREEDDAPANDVHPRHVLAAEAGELPRLEWWAGFDLNGALREPVPTWTATPPTLVTAVADVLAAALRAVAARPMCEAAWAQLLLLPRLLFAVPPASGSDERPSASKVLPRRLRQAWAGDWAALWAATARPGEPEEDRPGHRKPEEVARRVHELIVLGE
eukprot:2328083-Pyramimonas_sp.AAC.1